MARCNVCGRKAVIKIPYARLSLCRDHFSEYIENKVLKTIKRYKLISRDMRILLAVSGGKDSITATYILNKISKIIGFELYLFHIDLGIGLYSEMSKRVVRNVVQSLKIPLILIELKKILGAGIPELASKARRPACSVCGVVKRYIMNAAAIELKADAIATGHNLDDMATYVFKEFVNQNLEAISKLAPKIDGVNDIVAAKIRPLYEVYERESLVYVLANKIEFVKDECPHVRFDTLDNMIRNKLSELEERFPGFKISFIRKLVKNIEKYPKPQGKFHKCKICGLASSGELCAFCRLTNKVLGKPMGSLVREHIRDLLKKL